MTDAPKASGGADSRPTPSSGRRARGRGGGVVSLFGDPIGDGVRAGLDKVFNDPQGPFAKLIQREFGPMADELARLRWRTRWHPIDEAPAWIKDGRPVFVSLNGDVVVAAYRSEDGGYWDSDVEYGGEVIKPEAFYVLPRCTIAPAAARTQDGGGDAGA